MRFTSILLLVASVATADAGLRRQLVRPGTTTTAPVATTTTAVTPCIQRQPNDCEDDEICILKNDKGNKTCSAVSIGTAVDGQACTAYEVVDTEGNYYQDTCANGFICQLGEIDPATPVGAALFGTCAPTTCIGKKVPGNCNGNGPKTSLDQCDANTQRVTICHRTCSEKNPWVRITIDEDAWSGKGCGHQNHSILDECSKYGSSNWTAWGYPTSGHYKDYLLRFHGTRDAAAKTFNLTTKAMEKAYWREWEPACPYVRNGACCDWDAGECCGERPVAPTPAPVAPTPVPQGPTPVPVPTLPPVEPTSPPTKAPVPPPTSECPAILYGVNEVLIEGESLGKFPNDMEYPVKILSGNGTHVTFEVCEAETGVHTGVIYASFTEIPAGYTCYEVDSHVDGCKQFTAPCLSGHMAVVDVHVTDPWFDEPITPVPECCHPVDKETKSAAYTFALSCECPVMVPQ